MTTFVRQFYDHRLWWVWLATLVVHVVAALVQHSWLSAIPLALIGVGAFGLTLYRLEYGLALAFFEIFIGGHGHLINVDVFGFSLSVRMVLFAAVMAAWFLLFVTRKVQLFTIGHRDLPIALIALGVLVGAANGFLSNDPMAAFDDMNGFFTLAYFLPMISVQWNPERRRLLLMTLFAAAVWVAVQSLVFVYAFTHLPGKASHVLYTFIRDARLTEVTLQTAGRFIALLGNDRWYFRIFEQSQMIVVAIELLFLAATVRLWRDKSDHVVMFFWFCHALFIATILASLSRSFWLGTLAGAAFVTVFVLASRVPFALVVRRYIAMAIISALSIVAVIALVALPLPPRPDLSDSSFYKGDTGGKRELAVTSRWNLLGPMIKEISAEPIVGSGFGEAVTYISDDPRLREIDPTGEVTTYRFEWGFHDLWLKMGILGLFGFGWFFVTTVAVTWEAIRRQDKHLWLMIGFSAALVALYVTHTFSPYLNHPIGLGLILFLLPFFPWAEVSDKEAQDLLEDKQKPTIAVPQPSAGVVYRQ